MKKNSIVFCGILLLILTFSSCKKDGDSAVPSTRGASINIMNLCIDCGEVNSIISSIDDNFSNKLNYLSKTSYFTIEAKPYTIAFNNIGPAKKIASREIVLVQNRYYSAFLLGYSTDAFVAFVENEKPSPTPGKSKIRFINAAPDCASMSLYAGSDKVLSNISYKEMSAYQEIDTGLVNIIVTNGDENLTLSLSNLHLQSGEYHTVVLVGNTTGVGNDKLKLIEMLE